MPQQRILVLGASGYVGQNLIPQLIAAGHQVTAAARRVEWMQAQGWENTRCCYADLYDKSTLETLFQDIDVVYYLVHSMTDEDDLLARERLAAENVQAMLNKSAVREVIYLSAMQHKDSDSPHLAARRLTGEILADSRVPVTEIRAAIIVGPGSAAFEIMRDMVYNLPILTPPRWARSKSSPVALENLLNYLTGLLSHPATENRRFDATGPDYLSYLEMFRHFITISGKKRLMIPLPIPLRLISVHFLRLITTVPEGIAKELIMGLKYDLPGDGKPLQALIPQTLLSFDDAVRKTLKDEADAVDNEDWGYDPEVRARWRPGFGFYPKQAGFTLNTSASADALWHVVQQIGGKDGYFYANILWSVRARLDDLCGNKITYGRPDRDTLEPGDKIDGWKVITVKPRQQLSLLFGMKAPGLGRLTFTIRDHGHQRTLDVRAWWHPAGFSGLLYWFAMMPAHLFIFKGMAKTIVKRAAAYVLPASEKT
ncbi:DUF2867 domain-containing protein [Morganella morganii]|uniref:DUF2867 domain-containing protein n=1 Tax=Morganella morganii TaxID=582 RepID=UPI000BBD10DB|nr:DUF2867 domain-containing protein [Morganella morganii]ATF54281.1 NAD(P)-dependent oxidoreductase [Morganella morganii]MBT0354848.1 DUF2867 domain-containing protein [Morganella morganii subsp. morganii]MBT0373111.1 DUF2867 domain-containing protein [Morganella morganii subsp. morganii]MDN3815370.1 DUF2867 domain-containing protein [Morganella morganii]REL18648.1 DUF2867 domain-containing protein [Morganella morganii]